MTKDEFRAGARHAKGCCSLFFGWFVVVLGLSWGRFGDVLLVCLRLAGRRLRTQDQACSKRGLELELVWFRARHKTGTS